MRLVDQNRKCHKADDAAAVENLKTIANLQVSYSYIYIYRIKSAQSLMYYHIKYYLSKVLAGGPKYRILSWTCNGAFGPENR